MKTSTKVGFAFLLSGVALISWVMILAPYENTTVPMVLVGIGMMSVMAGLMGFIVSSEDSIRIERRKRYTELVYSILEDEEKTKKIVDIIMSIRTR